MDLDATDDELRDLTPVADLAEEIGEAIDGRVLLSAELRAAFDAMASVIASRVARQLEHAHRASSATPRRLVQIETRLADVDAWRLRIAGVAERNGRLGKVDELLADLRADVGTSDERRAERATIGSIRWTTAKVLALLAAAGVTAGGGVVATLRASAVVDAANARHAGALDAHETAQDLSITRLFTLCTSSRTP